MSSTRYGGGMQRPERWAQPASDRRFSNASTSSMELHAAMSAILGALALIWSPKAVATSTMTALASWEIPDRAMILLEGLTMVPPALVKLWRGMIFPSSPTPRTRASGDAVSWAILVSRGETEGSVAFAKWSGFLLP